MRLLHPLATLLLGASCIAAPALAALDPATERQIGGVYSNSCGDRSQVMIRLYGDVMDVERGNVAVKATRVQASKTAPPGAPVADFKALVRGDVKGGDGLVFVLIHNAKGLFARIDGGEKSLAPLGAGVIGQLIRHCDPNRNALAGVTAAPSPQGPPDLLKDARFKAAYTRALGALAGERWIARMEGPAPQLRPVALAGTAYTLAATCKPHDCSDHNLIVLWNEPQGQLVGLVHQRGRQTLLGAPSPAATRALEKLWNEEWRKR